MKSSYLPNQLPFLPGNTYADPTITRYHKTQLLGIKDGTITGKSKRRHFITYFFEFRENRELVRKCQPRLTEIHERRCAQPTHRNPSA
jgi:hypothetical protein